MYSQKRRQKNWYGFGIPWDNENDLLIYNFKELLKDARESVPTEQNLLKVASSFYDPLELILLQGTCRLKLDWDEEFWGKIREIWERNLNDIEEVENTKVDRRFAELSEEDSIVCRELHKSSGASKSGCVYIRSVCKLRKVTICLLTAKYRVSLLKTGTITRLELLGNALLSCLINSVANALNRCISFGKIYLWTDSKVALSWPPKTTINKYKTFVENRLREIRAKTDVEN